MVYVELYVILYIDTQFIDPMYVAMYAVIVAISIATNNDFISNKQLVFCGKR